MRAPVCILLLLIATFGAGSAWLGPDASWDLRNYHLYIAHAALAGTLWSDLAPAQLQSFYNPDLDIAPFLLRRALNAHPMVLDFVLAIPHAVAVWLVVGIACRMGELCWAHESSTYTIPSRHARAWRGHPRLSSGGALKTWMAGPSPAMTGLFSAVFGASGAASLSTLGTAMSEMVPACFCLAALYILLSCRYPAAWTCGVRHSASKQWWPAASGMTQVGAVIAAGLLTGAASGLKLVNTPYALALLAALPTARFRLTPLFLLAAILALFATAGPWWWTLWRHTGNPLFPYFNNLFDSPWADPAPLTDTRFLPHSFLQAILFPALWAVWPSATASELPLRDPRLLLGLLACLFLSARAVLRRAPAPFWLRLFLAFWLTSFILWEARFGVLRYAAVLELLSGIPVALALTTLLRGRLATGALASVLGFVIATTIYPNWGRAGPATLAAEVDPPPFEPGSLVLLLDPAPMAYVAAFAAHGAKFAGVNNNLVHPGDATLLARAVVSAVADPRTPLWGLESPKDAPGRADQALGFYGLERGAPCVRVRSNLDADALRACRLRRVSPHPASAEQRPRRLRAPD